MRRCPFAPGINPRELKYFATAAISRKREIASLPRNDDLGNLLLSLTRARLLLLYQRLSLTRRRRGGGRGRHDIEGVPELGLLLYRPGALVGAHVEVGDVLVSPLEPGNGAVLVSLFVSRRRLVVIARGVDRYPPRSDVLVLVSGDLVAVAGHFVRERGYQARGLLVIEQVFEIEHGFPEVILSRSPGRHLQFYEYVPLLSAEEVAELYLGNAVGSFRERISVNLLDRHTRREPDPYYRVLGNRGRDLTELLLENSRKLGRGFYEIVVARPVLGEVHHEVLVVIDAEPHGGYVYALLGRPACDPAELADVRNPRVSEPVREEDDAVHVPVPLDRIELLNPHDEPSRQIGRVGRIERA